MTRPRREIACPIPRIGLSAEEAAASINVSETTFRNAVEKGLMPKPKILFGRVLWDAEAVKAAFQNLPEQGAEVQDQPVTCGGSKWNDVAA